MKRRFSNKVRPDDGIFRYNTIRRDDERGLTMGQGSRSNLSLNDGLHRFGGLNRRNFRTEDLLLDVDETVEGVLQEAGVSPRPTESRSREVGSKYHSSISVARKRQSQSLERNTRKLSPEETKSGPESMFVEEYQMEGARGRKELEMEESGDEEEEIMFTHDMKDARLCFDISQSMSDLRKQILRFRENVLTLAETREVNRNLEFQNMGLTSDLAELQRQVDDTLGLGARMNLRGLNKNSVNGAASSSGSPDDDEEPELHTISRKREGWFSFKWMKWEPFKKDIRRIEAKFGSATTSYFVFSKWIFMEFMYLLPILLLFGTLHAYQLMTLGGYGYFDLFKGGIGFLPRFMIFSSYRPGESVDYAACIILGLGTLLISSLYKLVKDDKLHKEIVAIEGENYTASYAKDVLVAWDNSLETLLEVEDYGGSLSQKYTQKLDDTKQSNIEKEMTTLDYIILYIRRFLGFFLFIAVITTSFGVIIYLTVYSDAVKTYLQGTPVANFSGVVLNVALTIISSIAPEIMKMITEFEQWDSEWALRVILFRVYLSNTFNVFLVAISYVLLADPNFLYFVPTVSRSLYVPAAEEYSCRMDQVGYELFSLYFNDRVINLIIVFATGYFNYAYAKIFDKTWVKAEVDVQQELLTNITNAGVAMVVYVFCPLSLIFMPLLKAISIYIERALFLALYQKPKENWNAQKAEITFTRFYVVNILILGLPMAVYFLTSKSMPKDCSLQDDFYKLCVEGTMFQDVCELNPDSPYYPMDGDAGLCFNSLDEYYPRCICSGPLACGPFIFESDAFSSLKAFLTFNSYSKDLWYHLLSNSHVTWPIIMGLILLILLKRNTLIVDKNTTELKLMELLNQNDYLLWQNHHQDTVINKMKGVVQT